MRKFNLRGMLYASLIGAIYVVLTVIPGLSLISYGPIQFRVSEALTVLPIFTPWAIPGLTIGCIISNLMSQYGLLDIIFGSAATLLAAVCTYLLRKSVPLALLMPALFNGIIVGIIITIAGFAPGARTVGTLLFNMMTVAFGELVVCYALGYPLVKVLDKNRDKLFK